MNRTRRWLAAAGATSLVLGVACATPGAKTATPVTATPSSPEPSPETAIPASTPQASERAGPRRVAYRIEVHAEGLDVAATRANVAAILADDRGWVRAGWEFALTSAPTDVVITIAEGDEVDRRCAPYDTRGRFSCQLGSTVNLNADRWREATTSWPGDLATYRTYLVNHEVGHLIGLHHPQPQCPGDGYPAPIMLQQSTELGACTPNPWPLTWEIELAASGDEPFAPGYEPDPGGRPSPPPVRS